MIVNFECQKCNLEFDCDVGDISVPEGSARPQFGKPLVCPSCGQVTVDEVHLTELGQTQLTNATFPGDADFLDESVYFECRGCDEYLPVDDLGLCEQCAAKLDRDLLRQRQWQHAVSAFQLTPAQCERLRERVVREFGAKPELITSGHSSRGRKRKKRK